MPMVMREKKNVPFENYIAIGDDAWDVKMLENAVIKYCPADADESVKNIPGIKILDSKGGQGVISHLVRELLDKKPEHF
jgi:3-deoxy-D-manno-octulosonate 8-phosphate phosphatase KdsC-like HAD superfamily phosphatase